VSPQGLVAISFSISAGARYRLEFKDDLNTPGWSSLGGEHVAESSHVTAYDNVGPNQQRFYHIILLY
jgi:hypothetical protein